MKFRILKFLTLLRCSCLCDSQRLATPLIIHVIEYSLVYQNANCRAPMFSFSTTYNITTDILTAAYDWITDSSGITARCTFFSDVLNNIKERMPNYIHCQDQALQSIERAVSAWEYQRRLGRPQPLVLAFTGPTG